MVSPHIRTCYCVTDYEADGFFCEGMVMVIFHEKRTNFRIVQKGNKAPK